MASQFRQIQALEVPYDNILCQICSLPCESHTAIVHLVAELESVYNLLYHRYLKFAYDTKP